MTIKQRINNFLRSFGFQLTQYPDLDLRRRAKIIQGLNTDLILDVGANSGQYATLMRQLGYANQIISFEPLHTVFTTLQTKTEKDSKWDAHNFALGEKNYTTHINVSKNTFSSSILDISSKHVEAAPDSVVIEKEEIEVKTLNDFFPTLQSKYKNSFLKLDVQGFEKNVLEGASNVLHLMKGVQLELSLSPLYQNETGFAEMLTYMNVKGFELVSLENSLVDDATAFLLQADGIFINKHA